MCVTYRISLMSLLLLLSHIAIAYTESVGLILVFPGIHSEVTQGYIA